MVDVHGGLKPNRKQETELVEAETDPEVGPPRSIGTSPSRARVCPLIVRFLFGFLVAERAVITVQKEGKRTI